MTTREELTKYTPEDARIIKHLLRQSKIITKRHELFSTPGFPYVALRRADELDILDVAMVTQLALPASLSRYEATLTVTYLTGPNRNKDGVKGISDVVEGASKKSFC